jgi:hypothetical protein
VSIDWLSLPEATRAGEGCPLRMREEWLAACGPLACARCGFSVQVGELFFLSGRCAMGGEVGLSGVSALYSDLLEPAAEHVRCSSPPPGRGEVVCYTEGHGTRPLAELAAMLHRHGVRVLADIRTVPRSRHNPQYWAEALAESLPPQGICYVHLPDLGGLRRPRRDSPNMGWRNESFRGYADYMLTLAFEAALAELIGLLRVRPTAIMCAESVYWRCHRSLVADALLVRGVPSVHLMGESKSVPHTLTRFARPEGTRLVYPI